MICLKLHQKVDTNKIDDTIERSAFFQTVHVWPLNDRLNAKGWLSNFNKEEQVIASHILDFFLYYPNNMIEYLLINAVGKVGPCLLKLIPSWRHEDFKLKCYYSFIPGETENPTDSGYLFTRILREKLGIPEKRIVSFSEIPKISKHVTELTPIILVDDFVGSGAQCDYAWNEHIHDGLTLCELKNTSKLIFIYSPLFVNFIGVERIENRCKSLILSPLHILTKEYNLFDPSCLCWKNDISLYKSGTELILQKSKELGIPFTNGRNVKDVRGFGEQGLAIAFEHGAPDAIPPIFYWDENNWKPLIQKRYQR